MNEWVKDKKVICQYESTQELKHFGFDRLTSESCGYSMRILFDINQQARDILSSFFGGNVEFNNSGWNGREDHHWSVMLPSSLIIDIYIFAMLESGEYEICLKSDNESCEIAGIYPWLRFYYTLDDCNKERDKLRELGFNWRVYHGKNRNQHMFSGRIE